jgi:hypothetical protein
MPDHNVEVSNSRGQTRSSRFGGALGSYRIFKRAITANEAAPADDINQGTIVGDRYEECLWIVQKPAAVTAYTVHFLRWATVVNDKGEEIVAGFWVQDKTVVVGALHLAERQFIMGDALSVYIDGIVGATGAGFVIMRKGLVKRA